MRGESENTRGGDDDDDGLGNQNDLSARRSGCKYRYLRSIYIYLCITGARNLINGELYYIIILYIFGISLRTYMYMICIRYVIILGILLLLL